MEDSSMTRGFESEDSRDEEICNYEETQCAEFNNEERTSEESKGEDLNEEDDLHEEREEEDFMEEDDF